MVFVKLAVLLWVAFLIVRFFVRVNTTLEEKVAAAVGKKIKMTFGRWVLVIVFLLAIADSLVALIWFLFLR